MKLHLPSRLRAAVLACIAAAAGFAPTLASGVLAGGVASFAFFSRQAAADDAFPTATLHYTSQTSGMTDEDATFNEDGITKDFDLRSYANEVLEISGSGGGVISTAATSSSQNGGYGGRVFISISSSTSASPVENCQLILDGGIEASIANSALEGYTLYLDNASFYINSGQDLKTNIVVGSTGCRMNGGGGVNYTISGTITGSGNFYSCTGNGSSSIYLTGDLSGYTGSFCDGADGKLRIWRFGNGADADETQGLVAASFGLSSRRATATINYAATEEQGSVTFSGSSIYGAVVTTEGTADYSFTGANVNITTLNINSANTVTFSGSGATLASVSVTSGAALKVASGGSASVTTSLSGAGSLVNEGSLTLSGTVASGATLTNNAGGTLTLTGVLVVNSAINIATGSTVVLADGMAFDLSQMQGVTGDDGSVSYTVFAGDGIGSVGLTSDNIASYITGVSVTDKAWTYENGVISYIISSQDLFWNGGDLVWGGDAAQAVWSNEDGSVSNLAFKDSDYVTFRGASSVTLGADVTAESLLLEEGASVELSSAVEEGRGLTVNTTVTLEAGASLSLLEGASLTAGSGVTLEAGSTLTLTDLRRFFGSVRGAGAARLDCGGVVSVGSLSTILPDALELASGTTLEITSDSQRNTWNSYDEIVVDDGAMLSHRLLTNNALSSNAVICLAGAGTAGVTGGTLNGVTYYVEAALALGLATSWSGTYTLAATIILTADATVFAGYDSAGSQTGRNGTLSGAIDTAGYALSKTGAGTLNLTGNVGGGGGIVVKEGVVSYGSSSSSTNRLDVDEVAVLSGATFAVNHAAASISRVSLEGGALELQSATLVTVGTVEVAESGSLAGTAGSLAVSELTGSGALSVSASSGSVRIDSIRDYDGTITLESGSSASSLTLGVVDQGAGSSLELLAEASSSGFRKTGEGSLTLGAALHASGELHMSYDGTVSYGEGGSITVADGTVLTYGNESGTLSLNELGGKVSVNLLDILLDSAYDSTQNRVVDLGISSTLASDEDALKDLIESVVGLQESDYSYSLEDGMWKLTVNAGASVETEWDLNWGGVGLAGAPLTLKSADISSSLSLYGTDYDNGSSTAILLDGTGSSSTEIFVVGGMSSWNNDNVGDVERDSWIKIQGGSYTAIVGGNRIDNNDGNTSVANFIGNSHIYMVDGEATAIIGGNYQNKVSASFTGNTYITISGGSVSGAIIGASGNANNQSVSFTGDTHIYIYTPLGKGTSYLQAENPNQVAGGFCWVLNSGFTCNLDGSTYVEIDLTGSEAGTFARDVAGGNTRYSRDSYSGNVTYELSGSAHVGIAAEGHTVSGMVAGGDMLGLNATATIQGGTNVAISGGTFTNFVAGGSIIKTYSSTRTYSVTVNGLSSLSISSGTFNGGVLAGGILNAAGGIEESAFNANSTEVTISNAVLNTTYGLAAGSASMGGTSGETQIWNVGSACLRIENGEFGTTNVNGALVGGNFLGSSVASAVLGSTEVVIDAGTYTAYVAGGSNLFAAATSSTTSTSLSIGGGSFSKAVCGGDLLFAGSNTVSSTVNSSSISLTGGIFTDVVVGGSAILNSSDANKYTASLGKVEVRVAGDTGIRGTLIGGLYDLNATSGALAARVDSVSISLEGGGVVNLYGGAYTSRNANDATDISMGDVIISLASGSVSGDVYAAGYQGGTATMTTASTKVVLGSAVTLADASVISGGYEFAEGQSGSTVTGSRTLEFDGDQDRSGVTFKDFDIIDTGSYNVTAGALEAGDVIKTGSGALTLAQGNAISSLTVSEGVVALTSGGAGSLTKVTVAAGATLDASEGGTLGGALTLDDGAALTLSGVSGTALDLDGSALTWNGLVSLTLETAWDGESAVTLLAGLTEDLTSGIAFDEDGFAAAADYISSLNGEAVSDDAKLLLDSAGNLILSNGVIDLYWEGGTAGAWNSSSWASTPDGAGELAYVPTSNVYFTNDETAEITIDSAVKANNVQVSKGSYSFAATGDGSLAVSGTLTVDDGGSASFGMALSVTGDATVAAGSSLAVTGAGHDASFADLTNAGTVSSEGDITIAGDLENTGTITASNGTVDIQSSTMSGGVISAQSVKLGGTYVMADSLTAVQSFEANLGEGGSVMTTSLTVGSADQAATVTIDGSLSASSIDGASASFDLGGGDLTLLSGGSASSIGSLENAGTLTIHDGASLSITGTGAVSLGSLATGSETAFAGTGSLSVAGSLTLTSGASEIGSLTILGTDGLTLGAGAHNLVVNDTLTATQITYSSQSLAKGGVLLSVGELSASGLNIVVDDLSAIGLSSGGSVTLASLEQEYAGSLTLNGVGDSVTVGDYKYTLSSASASSGGYELALTASRMAGDDEYIWDGASDETWSQGGAWQDGEAPGGTSTAIFAGDGVSTVEVDGNGVTVGNITVDGASADYTFNGGDINVNDRLLVDNGSLTLENSVTAGETQVQSNGRLTIADEGSLTTDSVSGAITNNGDLVVTLAEGDQTLTSLSGSGSLTVGTDGSEEEKTLTIESDAEVSGLTNYATLNLGGNSLTISSADGTAQGGNVTAGDVTLQASGTDDLTNGVFNALKATGTVTAGSLTISDESDIGTLDAASLTVAGEESSATVGALVGGSLGSLTITEARSSLTVTGGSATIGSLAGAGSLVVKSDSVSDPSVLTLQGAADDGTANATASQIKFDLSEDSSLGSLGTLTANELTFSESDLSDGLSLTAQDVASLSGEDGVVTISLEMDLDERLTASSYTLLKLDSSASAYSLMTLAADESLLDDYGPQDAEGYELDSSTRNAYAYDGLYAKVVINVEGNLELQIEEMSDDMVPANYWRTSEDQTKLGIDVELDDAAKAYKTLDYVSQVYVDGERTIDLTDADIASAANPEQGLVIRNLAGMDEDGKLTLKGDENDIVTFLNDKASDGDETIVISGLKAQVQKAEGAEDGASLTVGALELEQGAVFDVEDGATFVTGTLTGGSTETIIGEVTASNGKYTGAYGDKTGGLATIIAGKADKGETLELGTGAGLVLKGEEGGNVTLLYEGDAPEAHSIQTTGAALTLDNVTGEGVDAVAKTLKLTEDSFVEGGSLTFSILADDLGTGTEYSVTSGAALDLLGGVKVTIDVVGGDSHATVMDIDLSKTEDIVLFTLSDSGSSDATVDFEFTGVGGMDKYFTNIHNVSGVIMADRVTDYYSSRLGDTNNGRAGAELLDDLLLTKNPQADADAMPDLAGAMDAIDAMLAEGRTAEADRVAAAMAGASIATLGAAFSADVDRQLRAIRNRTTTMGVNQCQVNEGMPYFNAWVNAEGDYRKLDQDGTAAGYTLESWGGTLGFDIDLTPSFTAGLALTAMYGDIDAAGPDHAEGDLDTYYVSLFARYASRAWTHTFVGTIGRADASLDRTVDYGTGSYKTSGDTEGLGFGLMYEVGYVLPLDEERTACLQPVFNIAWRHTTIDGYSEDGDAGLRSGDQTMDVVTFGLGVRMQATVGENIYNRTSIFEARALFKVDAGDRDSELDVAMLQGSRSAEIESAELGAVGVELGAGLTVPVGAEGGAFFVDASLELRSGYSNVNGTVGYRVNF